MDNGRKGVFNERVFSDGIQGEYDEDGFFVTPNGSKKIKNIYRFLGP